MCDFRKAKGRSYLTSFLQDRQGNEHNREVWAGGERSQKTTEQGQESHQHKANGKMLQ